MVWRHQGATEGTCRPSYRRLLDEEDVFRLARFFPVFFPDFFPVFFLGTFAPSRRASESPMAIAWRRLVTFLPDPPLRSVPAFISCITRSTFFDAFLPYLRLDVFLATGVSLRWVRFPWAQRMKDGLSGAA